MSQFGVKPLFCIYVYESIILNTLIQFRSPGLIHLSSFNAKSWTGTASVSLPSLCDAASSFTLHIIRICLVPLSNSLHCCC